MTASQNCLIVFTSSNLLEGLVALNRSVSKVAAWVMFDLDGESTGDAVGGDDTKIYELERIMSKNLHAYGSHFSSVY